VHFSLGERSVSEKQLVKPVEFSLGERIFMDLIPKVPSYSYRALILPVCPITEAL
jgi:hypothetical protein